MSSSAEFNKFASKWIKMPNLPMDADPIPLLSDAYISGAVIDSHRMIIIRNYSRTKNQILLYDDLKSPKEWISLPRSPGRGAICAATAIDQRLIVFKSAGIVNDVYMLELNELQWTKLPSPRLKLDCCTLLVNGSFVYSLAGFTNRTRKAGVFPIHSAPVQLISDNRRMDSVQRLNITTMEWDYLPNMCFPRDHFATTAIGDEIFVLGGIPQDGSSDVLSNVEVFNTRNLQWSESVPIPTASYGGSAVSAGRYIILTGGEVNHVSQTSIQIYDTVSQFWRLFDVKMPLARSFHISAILSERYLVVAGGYQDKWPFKSFASVEKIAIFANWPFVRSVIMLRWLIRRGRAFCNENHGECNNFTRMITHVVSNEVPDDIFKKICHFL